MAGSARGLFRAMGKGAVDTPARPKLEREKADFYPTPPEPTRALLRRERAALARYTTIWEPAAGDGAMAQEIEAAGHDCFRSDLIDRGCGAAIRDFYDYSHNSCPSRAIITNPPYQECNSRDGKARWIWHAMDKLEIEYMALLMSWNWPGAAGLGRLWAEHPPARVYLMRWKIDFTGAGSPPMLNAWFVWDSSSPKGYAPPLMMMDVADDHRQDSLLGE